MSTTDDAEVAPSVEQCGAEDDRAVRLRVKENRKLPEDAIQDMVERYQAGASIQALSTEYGLHVQTVRRHLQRCGVTPRPVALLSDGQEAEIERLYVTGHHTMKELGDLFNVCATTIRNTLRRRGVHRRPRGRCQGPRDS